MNKEYRNFNGVNVTPFIDRGLTKLFEKEVDAQKYAKRKHSYYYEVFVYEEGEIIESQFAVVS